MGGFIIKIVVGDDGLDVGEEVDVDSVVPHPKYDFGTDNYDIGLIFLTESISTDVPLLAINDDSSSPEPGATVFVMGWGDTNPDKSEREMPDELMVVELQVMSNEECEKATSGVDSYNGYIFDDMVCTESPGNDVVDACQGDSGEDILFDMHTYNLFDLA